MSRIETFLVLSTFFSRKVKKADKRAMDEVKSHDGSNRGKQEGGGFIRSLERQEGVEKH